MPIDEHRLNDAVSAATRVTDLESDLAGAKAQYRRAVRRLHLAGASMREIAEALDISHQRVHQMIDGGTGPRRWLRRGRQDPLFGQRACSFCGRSQVQVRKMIAGPDVQICGSCIAEAAELSETGPTAEITTLQAVSAGTDLACSFCGKRRAVVVTLVAGPRSPDHVPPTICSECLVLCQDTVDHNPDKAMTVRIR